MNQKQKRVSLAIIAVLLISIPVILAVYVSYTSQQIYRESTQNLLSTYSQVTKTFNMFAQRNWNILEVWTNDLEEMANDDNLVEEWRQYIAEKASWQYSEVVFFNEQDQFWTVAGRSGDAPHMQSALDELYASEKPVVTSYISSQNVRKVLFAQQIQPVTVEGTTYTSLGICYDNSVLEQLLGGLAYEGQSDCYVVRSNGDVVLSTEPKTQIPEQMTNLFDYLEQNAKPHQRNFNQMQYDVKHLGTGSITYTLSNTLFYLVYQPVGEKDWSIVGIVPASAVEGGMNTVQRNTTLILLGLFVIIILGSGYIFRSRIQAEKGRDAAEKQELQRRKELSDQMFQGITRIVDRFVLCDLDADSYEHQERVQQDLFPERGSYHDLMERASRKYVVLTDGENAKLGQMIAPENLRALLKTEKDTLKFEYAARDKSAFLMMTIVPCGWDNGRLTRVMMIVQDMGKQHMLQDLANTDGLTGLLNKRYFDSVSAALEHRSQPYALFYLDLDRFKPVNDTYGHAVGDSLLQAVTRRLQSCIRSTDYAFRLGGDEFALLLVGALSITDCNRKAEEIRRKVGEAYDLDGKHISIGTSCGWARFPADCPNAQQTRLLADKQMYEEKQRNHALLDQQDQIETE